MRKVQYEEMLPHEFEEALSRFPVAYVPVGSLEWHGRHLALGNDTLKAYGILLKTAETFGGVVVAPTYWGHMDHWRPGCHPGSASGCRGRALHRHFFDAVISDIRMPGMSGIDFHRQAVEEHPDLQDRFVFMSFAPGKAEAKYLKDHHIPFLPKPFGPEEMSEAVYRIMSAAHIDNKASRDDVQ